MEMQLAPKRVAKLHPTDILFQTPYWGRVKRQLGCRALAFDIEDPDRPRGDLLVLIQSCGEHGSVAYVPQGPEVGPSPENYGTYLESLSEVLAPHVDDDVVCIRYDLPWESQYAEEIRARRWNGYPEARVREMRMNFGTRSWNLRKATMDMTVASSLVVDLSGTEADLLARMKPKTRYNIGLARRRGVTVTAAAIDRLPDFYTLYCQTAARNGFASCEYRHFEAIFATFVRTHEQTEVLFLLASRKDDLLAGAIVALSGRRAVYLYGASATANRNLMGPYAVHWHAMQYARRRGCVDYDMGAVSPGLHPDHPFYGLYRFKTGFGGRIELRTGSWDYPLHPEAYQALRNAEGMSRGRNA
ncbi:lipid II:glycine glycyltransferase FemX [Desulfatitalea alkaliphila]|uniref:Peptidoglycan bridge formation glycyltransferase FemA/FemB family protein n=1 Tax=Desulfatitalea alkaliphila TaxID=2929485 RepID=A0AA41R0C5_9BACT|nr:peptidoglycan bridge formation glycyltransferase FemA/FemB family protein [Desulfatitalea alkaliphila]MCJ8500492.1 peptidoglycan bridge formation glycyltransferase FemA/FemB family protein [Desulfatitalea alkaliphila]